MQWFVYVIANASKLCYTGIAKDVAHRLHEHNAGKGAKFTRGRGPWTVLHSEGPLKQGEALRREAEIRKDRAFKRALKAASAGLAGDTP